MDWRKIIHRCEVYAIRQGFEEVAEDFAAFVCEQTLLERDTSARNLWVDFLRKNILGGKKLGLVGLNGRKQDQVNPEVSPLEDVPDVPCEEDVSFDDLIFAHYEKGSDRAVAMLIFKWGFSQREVGELFGFSEARISQIVKRR
jgi:hypothetical protein